MRSGTEARAGTARRDSRTPTVLTVGELFSRVVGRDPVFLIGAGASVKSGIPASADLVRLAMKWIFAARQGWPPHDMRIKNSDIGQTLAEQPWYRPGEDLAPFLPNAIEALDQPRDRRREFLLELVAHVSDPSAGYQHLARLLKRRAIRTVLTPNFDDLISIAYAPGGLIPIDRAQFSSISTNPSRPQVVFIHGKAEHYLDRSLLEEVQHLEPELIAQLLPLLRDHPVVVVGYRGGEPSVMRDLFLNNVDAAQHFRHGIYWCARAPAASAFERLDPLVHDLASALGQNFMLVPGNDFDALMAELADLWDASGAPIAEDASLPPSAAVGFDAQPSAVYDDEGTLNWDRVVQRLSLYAARNEMPGPDGDARAWSERQLVDCALATRADDRVRMTNAGALLMTGRGRSAAAGAYVELRMPGKPPQAIDGDLWEQHEAVLAALDEVNRPVRMKGERSATVRPYPDAALKEVVANALIHRDYESAVAITVVVSGDGIKITNPGGLERDLLRRLLHRRQLAGEAVPADLLQRQLEAGERGKLLTGYRNRVLADLFYGTGVVDKAGSGLADALEAIESVGGRLRAEISADNGSFTVTLFRRPARVDARTATAQPVAPTVQLRMNLFEVTALPERVWCAPTDLRFGSLFGNPVARTLPPHVLYDGMAYTFADLTDADSTLRPFTDTTQARAIAVRDWVATEDGERRFVHLVNEALFSHLHARDLITRFEEKLAYYACRNMQARYVVYRSRTRPAQRRRMSRWAGETATHCEHKAARFHFARHGDAWTLAILPTYVFTRDGARYRMGGREASSLATRASTDDYNQKVAFDVVFWGSILADGEDRIWIGAGPHVGIELRGQPISTDLTPLQAPVVVLESAKRP